MKYIKYAALLLFLISFALPACRPDRDAYSGWACFQFCFTVLSERGVSGLWKFYYLGFAVINFTALVLFVISFLQKRRSVICISLGVFVLFYALSFLGLNFVEFERQGKLLVDYGYYAWVLSFVFLVAALVANRSSNEP
jgi:hypothetical protein